MSGGGRRRRLFFALWPDAAVRNALESATRKVVRASGGRPVAVSNLHITLAFLGPVSEAQCTSARAIAAALRARPFELRLQRIAHFARAAVLVLEPLEPPAELISLAERLAADLGGGGFELDARAFRPHLTLARKVRRAPREAAARRPVRWPVEQFALVESTTAADGPRYELVADWTLRLA